MDSEPCNQRILMGALATGEIEGEAARMLRRHVQQCPVCAEELRSLTAVVNELNRSDLTVLSLPEMAADLQLGARLSGIRLTPRNPAPDPVDIEQAAVVEARILAEIERELRAKQRRRLTAIAGIAAALLAVVGISVVAGSRKTGRSQPVTVAMSNPSGGKTNVELRTQPWGTEIDIRTDGLKAGVRWGVWLERPDGSRVPAGSFTSTATTRPVSFRLTSALALDGAAAVGMTDFVTKEEVRANLPSETTHSYPATTHAYPATTYPATSYPATTYPVHSYPSVSSVPDSGTTNS